MFLTEEQKVLQSVIRKAKADEAFKETLIANPIEAIKAATGVDVNIPEGKTLIVEDQTDTSVIYVNIPPKQHSAEDVELTEEQLELVAGGTDITRPSCFDPGPIICFPPYGTPPYNPFPEPVIS